MKSTKCTVCHHDTNTADLCSVHTVPVDILLYVFRLTDDIQFSSYIRRRHQFLVIKREKICTGLPVATRP